MEPIHQAELAAVLQRTHLVGWLGAARLPPLTALCTRRVCRAGEEIFRRGARADAWTVILAGTARPLEPLADPTMPRLAGAGHAFGARGLFDVVSWPVTLRAESDLSVLLCTPAAFAGFAAGLSETDRHELQRRALLEDDFRFLRTLRAFAQLTAADLAQILDQSTPRRLARGEYLFREDEKGASCYIVRSGRVQLLKQVDASHKHLATRRSGDLVGEIELLYSTPRMADALAASDVDLFELPAATFDALVPDGRCRETIFSTATDRLLQYQNALAESDRRALQEQLPTLSPRWVTVRPGLVPRAYPFVAAATPSGAGVACLAMVDRQHGRDSAWEAHLEQLLGDGEPDTLVSLSRKADECGYITQLLRVDAQAASRLPLPAIVEDEGGSPAVLFRVTRRVAVVANPRGKLREIPRADFTASWRGPVLTVTHPAGDPLRDLLRANVRAGAAIAAASLLIVLFGLAAPLAAKVVVDRVVVGADTALLRLLTLGLGVILALRLAAGVLREQLLVHATRRAVLALQVRLLDHVLRLPLGAAQQIGDAAGFRHTERVVESAVTAGLPLVVDTLAVAIGVSVVFALSAPLALIAAAFVLGYSLLAFVFPPWWRPTAANTGPGPSARGYLIELVAGIQTVKALASEPLCTVRGTRLMLESRSRDLAAARARGLRQVAGTALHLAALVGVLGYGAALTLAGRATAGDVVASLAIVAGLVVPVEALLEARGAAAQWRRSAAATQRLFQLPPETSAGRGVAPRLAGHVRLTDVSFRYPGTTEDALAGVNLEILPGQTVALVGRSGSGKTTLVNLLAGVYPPAGGTIQVDGTDLTAVPKPALRRQLGIVEQHPFLFDGTVADNISRGDPSVTRERIIEAARLAGVHEVIAALAAGYDTPVGERGARLSGGERQRLTIARALIVDPRLLILDEATSALDGEAEHALYARLQGALAGRTMIVIAHRLSTVRHADVIVVLDRGRVVETGSDRDLMARRGLYYYLTTRTV